MDLRAGMRSPEIALGSYEPLVNSVRGEARSSTYRFPKLGASRRAFAIRLQIRKRERVPVSRHPLTCVAFVAGTGFEPVTSGL